MEGPGKYIFEIKKTRQNGWWLEVEENEDYNQTKEYKEKATKNSR